MCLEYTCTGRQGVIGEVVLEFKRMIFCLCLWGGGGGGGGSWGVVFEQGGWLCLESWLGYTNLRWINFNARLLCCYRWKIRSLTELCDRFRVSKRTPWWHAFLNQYIWNMSGNKPKVYNVNITVIFDRYKFNWFTKLHIFVFVVMWIIDCIYVNICMYYWLLFQNWNSSCCKSFQIIRFSVIDFELEFHKTCSSDFVEILDGSRIIGQYCGSIHCGIPASTGNVVTVRMSTNGTGNAKGFSINYVAADPPTSLGKYTRKMHSHVAKKTHMTLSQHTVETLYNTIYYSKYFIELNFDKSTQYVALWTHKRHSIPRPFGRAMECLLWVFQQKLIVL